MIQAGTVVTDADDALVKLSQNDVLRLMIPVPESAVAEHSLRRSRSRSRVDALQPTLHRQDRPLRRAARPRHADDATSKSTCRTRPRAGPGMYAQRLARARAASGRADRARSRRCRAARRRTTMLVVASDGVVEAEHRDARTRDRRTASKSMGGVRCRRPRRRRQPQPTQARARR